MAHQTFSRIVIIEDDSTLRNGYQSLIDQCPGFKTVGTYTSAEKALLKLDKDKPNLILLDIGLPGMSGIDAIPRIKQILPFIHILILTVYESEEVVFNALKKGVSGFLTKDSTPEKVLDSIREIVGGGGSMSSNVARLVVRSFYRNQQSPLSRRESQILLEIANGKGRGKIAEELFIHSETVKTHVKNIYTKLEVHSKADALKAAREKKLL